MKIAQKFKKLNKSQKIEFIAASLLSLTLIIGLPVYAWFHLSNDIETMTKIKEPDNLDIRAGNYDQIINFDLSGLDIEKIKNGEEKGCFVFSVSAGDYKINYNLQLAHTTNIPFQYKIYKATETSTTSGSNIVEYHPLEKPDQLSYYLKGDEIPLTTLNPDTVNAAYYGRTLALDDDSCYDITYSDGDSPEIYAIPIYMQTTTPIVPQAKGANEHDFYILELTWNADLSVNAFKNWNKAENNKETDIICITASRSTG